MPDCLTPHARKCKQIGYSGLRLITAYSCASAPEFHRIAPNYDFQSGGAVEAHFLHVKSTIPPAPANTSAYSHHRDHCLWRITLILNSGLGAVHYIFRQAKLGTRESTRPLRL